jgi:Periplasmic lysozyme inhibitor of I-type lysozyme
MKSILLAVISVMLLMGSPLSATEIIKGQLHFKPGQSGTTVKGKLKGSRTMDYQIHANAGQSMVVTLKSRNLSMYFNILPPASDSAIFVGSSSGDRFEGTLPADGLYTIRVYLMRNAARRNETAHYTLEVNSSSRSSKTPALKTPTVTDGAFSRVLELQGIRFTVTCKNEGSINTLHIVPAGLEIDNSPIVREIEGTVAGAEVADLNLDGSPEIYVYVTSAGSGSYGSLVAYAANRRKSLSEIYLPPITEDKRASKGYMGHDEFAVVESVLVQRFPVYHNSDTNAKPTGGMRQIQYKLVPGEAGWILKAERMAEY